MKKNLTIAISAYNSNNLLRRVIESIGINNTDNVDVLVIDDGSIIPQINFVPDYFLKHKNFRIIRKKNGGLSSTRNCAINNAKTKFIFFVDGDDFLIKKNLDKFINYLNKISDHNDVDLIRIGYRRITKKTTRDYIPKKKTYKKMNWYILRNFFSIKYIAFSSWTHIYNIDFLKKNNLFFNESIYAEDLEHLLRAYNYISIVLCYDEVIYCYDNTNTNSIMYTKLQEVSSDILKILVLNYKEIKLRSLKLFIIIWFHLYAKRRFSIKHK